MDRRYIFFLFSIASAIAFLVLHSSIERHQSISLSICFLILAFCYLIQIKNANHTTFLIIFISGVLFRLIFFFHSPTLSEDVYRYIWDGKLQQANIPVFESAPSYLIKNGKEDFKGEAGLYQKLNSKEYLSVYPPVAQVLFYCISLPEDESFKLNILIFRLIIFAYELIALLSLLLIIKIDLLKNSLFALWWLNPLLIIEGIGNLHLEIFSASLLIIYLYYLQKHKIFSTSFTWAMAFLIKLNPAVMLPALFPFLSFKKILWFAISFISVSILFISFNFNLSFINGLETSLAYYFSKFEFNASVYYLLRWIGYQVTGYNMIAKLGPLLGILTFTIILGDVFIKWIKKKQASFLNVVETMQNYFFVYLIFSTTIHPWYVIPLVSLSAITKQIYPIIWSLLIPFTYVGYTAIGFAENQLVLILEYGIVLGIFFVEKRYNLQSYLFPKLTNHIN